MSPSERGTRGCKGTGDRGAANARALVQLREKNEGAIPVQNGAGPKKISYRRMPLFDEKRDDLDACIMPFERLATGHQWPSYSGRQH